MVCCLEHLAQWLHIRVFGWGSWSLLGIRHPRPSVLFQDSCFYGVFFQCRASHKKCICWKRKGCDQWIFHFDFGKMFTWKRWSSWLMLHVVCFQIISFSHSIYVFIYLYIYIYIFVNTCNLFMVSYGFILFCSACYENEIIEFFTCYFSYVLFMYTYTEFSKMMHDI